MKTLSIFLFITTTVIAQPSISSKAVVIPGNSGVVQGASTLSEIAIAMGLNIPRSFNNVPSSKTIQVIADSANGFQVSSTRDSAVTYSVTVVTTATIGGSSSGYVVLEIAETNSVTASDWKETGRVTNAQTITLALALQSALTIGGSMSAIVPAGYYARLRSVNVSGTPSYAYVSGQEVLL